MAMRDVRAALAAGIMLVLAACGGGGGSTDAADNGGAGGDEAAVKADISAGTHVTAGEALGFDGSGSSGDGLTYRWQFGDGGNGGGARIAHVFTQAGTYDVALTVVDGDGQRDKTTVTVTVDPGPAPAATNGTLNGAVTDTAGAALSGVTVAVVEAGVSASTDASGEVSLGGLDTGVDLVLRLTAAGYAEQFVRTRIPAGTTEARFEATLIAREDAGTVSADSGGAIIGSDGTGIEVPPNGLVDGNGDPVGGSVDVALTPVDTSNDDEFSAFPGSFGAIERNGDEVRLATLGVAEFLLEQGGEELQLAPGATAELTIPLYATQRNGSALAAGDTIPFWSLDEATGEWVREGSGTVVGSGASPTGLAFTITVSHLSWWNCDIAETPATVTPTFGRADGGGFDPGENVYVTGAASTRFDPRSRTAENVRADNPSDGLDLPIPPDRDVELTANARNGTLIDSKTVNAGANTNVVVDFVLAPPGDPDASITLPYDEPGAIDPAGELDRFTFAGTAGQGIQVEISGNGSDLEGTIALEDAGGNTLRQAEFYLDSPQGPDALVDVLPADGDYTVVVDGTAAEPGGYQLSVRALPQLAPDSQSSATVAPDGQDLYVTEIESTAVVTGLVASADPSFDDEAWSIRRVDGFLLFDGADRRASHDPWVELAPGGYIVAVSNNRPVEVNYDIALATVQAPTDMATAARNRSTATGTVTVPGDVVLHRIPGAAADDGLFAALEQDGGTPLPAGRLGVGVVDAGQGFTVPDFGISVANTFSAAPDPADGILANRAGRLNDQLDVEPDDEYFVVMKAGFGTGGYRLRVDRAPGGGALTADRDGNCDGDTRSVRAAVHAANGGDTVTVCAGRYQEANGLRVPVDNLTLSGSGNPVIATTAASPHTRLLTTVDEGTSGLVLEGVTLEPGAADQQAFYGDFARIDGGGVTDVVGTGDTALSVTTAGAVVENTTFSGMDEAISVQAAGVTIRNNTFIGGAVAIQDGFAGQDTTLRGNTFDATGVNGQLIDLDDGAVIEGNDITASVVDPPSDNDTPLIVLRETGNGTRGISIAGNRIETDGGGLWIPLSGSNVPTVDIEANELYFTNPAGAEGLDIDGPNLTGGSTSGQLRIRNNVIDGIVDAEIGSLGDVNGIEIVHPDALASLAFVNNSIRAIDGGATAGDAAIVLDDLADSGFSGPLGVDFVNNLLIGPGSNADAVRLASGTSFDADFNYFSGFNSTYAGGTTTTGGNDQAGPADLVTACTDGDDTTACRLEVQSSAGAVDAGTGSGYTDIPADDIDGTARPINVIDIGAHEQ
jgi:hypothetical protein